MKKIEVYICDITKILFIMISIVMACFVGIRIVKAVEFRNNCSIHIWRAEDAPNAETASSELKMALTYMRENGFTHGQVLGIIEEEDSIGFCYENLCRFEQEFANFSLTVESEVYHVELNALQERMKASEPPYFISIHNKVLVWVYVLTIFAWSISLMAFAVEQYSSRMVSIYVPTFKKIKQ